jgi:hypothetical protein
MYVLIVLTCVVPLWRNGSRMKSRHVDIRDSAVYVVNEATLIAMCGLVVCSLFLSLQQFEIFYCLNVLTNAVLFISRKDMGAAPVRPPGVLARAVRLEESAAGTGARQRVLRASYDGD